MALASIQGQGQDLLFKAKAKAKTCTTKAKAKAWPSEGKAKAKTSKWCPRGSSRPRPGLEDNKTVLNQTCNKKIK